MPLQSIVIQKYLAGEHISPDELIGIKDRYINSIVKECMTQRHMLKYSNNLSRITRMKILVRLDDLEGILLKYLEENS